MVDLALHVQDGDAAGRSDIANILVALPPIHVAHGDAVAVAANDRAKLLGCVAMLDLRGAALNKLRVPAKLGHARLKADPRPRAAEEEQHGQHLIA